MRKLIFVKGPPGSGKSHFIKEMGFEPYSLSRDQIRLLLRSPELNSQGLIHISQDDAKSVQNIWFDAIKSRIERGEFLVLEGIFNKFPKDILDLARKNLYDCVCVDFSTMPIKKILEQNESRENYKFVSPAVIKKFHVESDWENIKTFKYNEDNSHITSIKDWCHEPILDFNKYKRIVHIGDLQGCFTVLTDSGLLKNFPDPETAYVFCGDLLDRGIENGKLLRWFIDNALNLDNVYLIWGNHEEHLKRWAVDEKAVSEEFLHKTLPQLLASHITKEEALRVCKKAVEALFYVFDNQRVMVTHAGLPTVPVKPELISLKQYSKGTGFWSDPIDEQFERHAPSDWVQVHGHRNHNWREIQATKRSFNLEDEVEFGGNLRWVSLTSSGWEVGQQRNTVFDSKNSAKLEKKKYHWDSIGTMISKKSLQQMQNHGGVRQKELSLHPHIWSFNFTKDVFFKSTWDDVVVKARGFFVNKNTKEIVSRGYDKFFNIDERPETKLKNLADNLAFPVVGYLKENGYLGNIGYDSHTGDLFIATKSSSSGDFSIWFREILDKQMSKTMQGGLARWLRDNEACMTFEVIDPINDPHMISYDKPQLILLDIFHRSEDGKKMSYEDLKTVARKFNFDCKQRGIVLQDKEAFTKWYEKVACDLTYRYHGKDIEGFVFEDQKGFMTKIKMPHYSFWKKMRSQKDRMSRAWLKEKEAGLKKNAFIQSNPRNQAPLWDESNAREKFADYWRDIGKDIHPVAAEFLDFCARLPESDWNLSIIQLRAKFLQVFKSEELWKIPFKLEYKEALKKNKSSLSP